MFNACTCSSLLTFLYFENRFVLLSSPNISFILLLLKSIYWTFNFEKSYLVFWFVLAKSRMYWYAWSNEVRDLLLKFRFSGPLPFEAEDFVVLALSASAACGICYV